MELVCSDIWMCIYSCLDLRNTILVASVSKMFYQFFLQIARSKLVLCTIKTWSTGEAESCMCWELGNFYDDKPLSRYAEEIAKYREMTDYLYCAYTLPLVKIKNMVCNITYENAHHAHVFEYDKVPVAYLTKPFHIRQASQCPLRLGFCVPIVISPKLSLYISIFHTSNSYPCDTIYINLSTIGNSDFVLPDGVQIL